MEYKPFMVAFTKASTRNEYRFQIYANSEEQALSIARSRLSKKLGKGEFDIVKENRP